MPPGMGLTTRKKAAFFLVMFLMTASVIEAMSRAAYWVKTGVPPFALAPERFDIRNFNVRVADERTFTLKPNFKDDRYGARASVRGYRLHVDGFGFREGTHKTDAACASVVFLGDSVPFGWGISDGATLPSKVQDRLAAAGDPRCVINAAAPSYSLFQAVARFEKEVSGKFPVDTVYLQTYDPASQVVLEGRGWQPDLNWATPRQPAWKSDLEEGKYGAAAYFVFKALVKPPPPKPPGLDVDDAATIARFRGAVRQGLQRLLAAAREAKAKRVVIAPVVVPQSGFARLSAVRRKVLDVQNGEFRAFAAASGGAVQFFDAGAALEPHKESDVFIDACCHLSERGSDVLAETLFRQMRDPR